MGSIQKVPALGFPVELEVVGQSGGTADGAIGAQIGADAKPLPNQPESSHRDGDEWPGDIAVPRMQFEHGIRTGRFL